MSDLRTPRDAELREQAVKRLKQRREFYAHLLVYLMVNAFLVVLWWMLTPDIFFWPVIPIVLWGIGVVMNGYEVYFAGDIDESDIQGEIQRMQHRR